ncbi:MAG: MFS transporter [Hyphomonas sp.]|nr:MFS transporter [Hyphomonas sp.]
MGLNDSWRAAIAAGAVNLVVGANLPYLPVWMDKIGGMSGAEIAGAGTLAALIRIVAGPLAAGRAQSHGLRATLATVMAVCLAGYALLFPGLPHAAAFFVCVTIYSAANVAGPLFEAVLVYGTRATRPDYGQGRALASTAFVTANLAGGAILSAHGPDGVLVFLAASAALASIAPLFTRQGARQVLPKRTVLSTFREGFALYRIPSVFAFVLAAALIQASHGAYYSFSSVIWVSQGISGSGVGALWAIGVTAEIVLLVFSARLPRRLGPVALLWLGGLGAILRWTAAGFALPLFAIALFQPLHAASFALTHLGTMRFLQATLPDERLPLAYAVNGALVFGPILAASSFLAGLGYDALAPGGVETQARIYWLMVLAAAAGLAVAALKRPVPGPA